MIRQAYSKLNAETNMYPDLIGIDVSENDLLSRVVEEQSNRAKICEVAEKAEVSSILFCINKIWLIETQTQCC